jgi:hypothetical protein
MHKEYFITSQIMVMVFVPMSVLSKYQAGCSLGQLVLQTQPSSAISFRSLNELLESPVDGRADVGHILPEVNGGNGALGDALGGELELL